MNDDQRGDAASQQKRGRYESPTQWAPGIEPTMASKNERDVSLQLGRLPSGQATPDPQDHCHLKEAAASGSSHAAHSKNLRHQQYRHSNLAAIRRIRRMVQRSGQDLLSSLSRFVHTQKPAIGAQSNARQSHKSGIFGSKIVS
jgi:hypothetical protein